MDCLEGMKLINDNSIDCCITSPPYWGLRDYGVDGQIGLESNPYEYVDKITHIFNEVKRVLKPEGTLWLNLGDSYVGTGNKGNYKDPKYKDGRNGQFVALNNKVDGLKQKDLIGIPWRVAFALQEDGWYLRSDIIWSKPNPMPESVKDRPTKAHEYIFLMSKNRKYYYDNESIKEDCVNSDPTSPRGSKGVNGNKNSGLRKQDAIGKQQYTGFNDRYKPLKKRNKRTVWTVTPKPLKEAHFATFPPDLILPCVLAGCPEGGVIIDPFMGAGTTALVAQQNNRNFIGFEINPDYINITNQRIISAQ